METIGLLMILSFFIGVYALAVKVLGARLALVPFIFAVFIAGWLKLAVYLTTLG